MELKLSCFSREAKMHHFCTCLMSSSLLIGKNCRPLEGIWSPLFRLLIAHFLSSASKTQQFSSTQRRNLSLMQCSFCISVLRTLLPMIPLPGLRETLSSHSCEFTSSCLSGVFHWTFLSACLF